jgi:hypothetical protein
MVSIKCFKQRSFDYDKRSVLDYDKSNDGLCSIVSLLFSKLYSQNLQGDNIKLERKTQKL